MSSQTWKQVVEFKDIVSNMVVLPSKRSYFWGLFTKDDGYLVISTGNKIFKFVDSEQPKGKE